MNNLTCLGSAESACWCGGPRSSMSCQSLRIRYRCRWGWNQQMSLICQRNSVESTSCAQDAQQRHLWDTHRLNWRVDINRSTRTLKLSAQKPLSHLEEVLGETETQLASAHFGLTPRSQWSSWCSASMRCPITWQCDRLRRRQWDVHLEKTCREEKPIPEICLVSITHLLGYFRA